jgi:hypothetical protein
MRKLTLIFSLFLSSIALAQQPTRSADDVAHRALDILGGGSAWEKARYIAFTFNVERDGKVISSFPQALDRYTGDYRVSGKRPDGVAFDVVVNIRTKKGHGKVAGKDVTERTQWDELYEIAYRRFLNDMNWLLMPLEMFDPGVRRTYDGERTDSCGHTWDVIKLSFDANSGLNAGDVYWLWINRDTGVVEEWDTKLASAGPEEPPLQLTFRDYKRVGGLLLSARRDVKGKNQSMRFDNLQILPEVPKKAFE